MRVLLAPDSFKGSCSAAQVAEALTRGWRRVDAHTPLLNYPMADGGEGTLDAFQAAYPAAVSVPVTVTGPHGRPHQARWLRLPDEETGVVELASTSGIELLDRLRPWDADTYGLGEAMSAAMDAGMTRLIVGIGSSASTDAGTGLLRALGARFADAHGTEVVPGAAGLDRVAHVDVTALRSPVTTLVITDVTHPLTGVSGAAAVFGPQKGFATSDIPRVDAHLSRVAALIEVALGTQELRAEPGAGAAGGAGFGLLAWGAQLLPGASEIASLTGLTADVQPDDLIITGEGFFDRGSAAGKVPDFLTRMHSRVALVAGGIAANASTAQFCAAISLTELAGGADLAIADPERFLEQAGKTLANQFAV